MGVMIPMKRERMLTIRVTDDEHARLLERCEGKQLAVWMRRGCLGGGGSFKKLRGAAKREGGGYVGGGCD